MESIGFRAVSSAKGERGERLYDDSTRIGVTAADVVRDVRANLKRLGHGGVIASAWTPRGVRE